VGADHGSRRVYFATSQFGVG